MAEQLVQLLIVSDGELEMTGDDTGLLVVASGVASKLEDFGSEVLKDSSEVDGGTWEVLLARCVLTSEMGAGAYRHRHAGRSCPSSTDGGHDQLGMQDQPWMND